MLRNSEGQRIPQVTFRTRQDGQWKDVTTDAALQGPHRRRVLAARRLHADLLVDAPAALQRARRDLLASPAWTTSSACRSTTRFVMSEWQKDQNAPERSPSSPTATANSPRRWACSSTSPNLGFGKRSWRYSMLVKDGVIEKMFIEPEKEGDPFEVSDADTMLDVPRTRSAKAPEPVAIFTKPGCPHCARAKALLDKRRRRLRGDRPRQGHHVLDAVARSPARAPRPRSSSAASCIGGADELEAYFARRAEEGGVRNDPRPDRRHSHEDTMNTHQVDVAVIGAGTAGLAAYRAAKAARRAAP